MPPPILHITHKARYLKAHSDNFALQYPMAFKDHGLPGVVIPDTRKSNGLTRFCINFLLWSGHRATRISASGRLIDSPQKQESGISLMTKKWIKGSTRSGSADISATVFGRSLMIEVKCGNDRPSGKQLREQALERKAGGIFEFIHNTQEFFDLYDRIILYLKHDSSTPGSA